MADSEDPFVREIYKAAQDKRPSKLKNLLSNVNSQERDRILNLVIKDGDELLTPLMIASKNGHTEIVKILLGCKIDIEARGTVRVANERIEGVTALWTAAATEHFDVVKFLLQHGANVDGVTKENSTPLRAAAFDGRLDIVSHLVKNGANVNARTSFERTSLMLASYRGHKDVVIYLAKNGADLDAQAKSGSTALHCAAEMGHVDIVKELLARGAKLVENANGLNPLLHASCNCKINIVEFLISNTDCTQSDRILALELLGGTILNESKEVCDIKQAFQFISRAMKERFKGKVPVPKEGLIPPLEAYQYRTECKTIKELREIENDSPAVHMEGLLIRERILGPDNPELIYCIRYRGAVFADNRDFKSCIPLLKRAMNIRRSCINNNNALKDQLETLIDVFCNMIQKKIFPRVKDVLEVLDYVVSEQARLSNLPNTATESKVQNLTEDLDSITRLTVCLLTIATKLTHSEYEECILQSVLFKFLRMNPRTKQGSTLLHLAVSNEPCTTSDDTRTKAICTYPSLVTTKVLLKNGVKLVNTADAFGNTPLHIVVMTEPKPEFLETVKKIIEALQEAGVHKDLANAAGQTAMAVAATDDLKQLVKL